MFNRYLTYYSAPMQFMALCAVLSMCMLMGGTVMEFLHVKITGIESTAVLKMTEIPTKVANTIKWLNPLMLMAILLLPACLFAYLAFPQPMQYLGAKQKLSYTHLFIALGWLLLALPLAQWLETVNQGLSMVKPYAETDNHYDKIAQAILSGTRWTDLIGSIFFICLIPAMVEEFFFRGCLQQVFMNWFRRLPWLPIVLVAVIFSAFHMQMSAFIPRLFLGLLLGITYYFTANIWISILLHFVNNALSVCLIFLYNKGIIQTNVFDLPTPPLIMVIISILSTVGIGYIFFKKKTAFPIFEVDKTDE